MSDHRTRSEESRLRHLARYRRRREAEVRRTASAKGVDLRTLCGLTRKPCAWAADCAWNEEQRQTVRRQRLKDGSSSFKRLEVCALAILNEWDRCDYCKARCSKVWRCFRAERLAAEGARVPDLRSEAGEASGAGESTPEACGAICNGAATSSGGNAAGGALVE